MKKTKLIYYEEAGDSEFGKLKFSKKGEYIYDHQAGEDFLFHMELVSDAGNASVKFSGQGLDGMYAEADTILVKAYFDGVMIEILNQTSGKNYFRAKYHNNFIQYYAMTVTLIEDEVQEEENPLA